MGMILHDVHSQRFKCVGYAQALAQFLQYVQAFGFVAVVMRPVCFRRDAFAQIVYQCGKSDLRTGG